MMKGLHCRFVAGVAEISFKQRLSPVGWRWQGNGIRGALTAGALTLLALRAWGLGLALLCAALAWSCGEICWREGKSIRLRQQAAAALRQGNLDTVAGLFSAAQPGGDIWVNLVGTAMAQGRWHLALSRLEQEEEEEPYLVALAFLGLGQPAKALNLCEQVSDANWLMLKAQCLYRLKRWQDLLTLLARQRRVRERHPDREWDFLRGAAYYHLGQHKPAIRLLRRCNGYPLAARWLAALEKRK